MDWTEILFEISAEDVETASNICTMAVPYGFYIEDYSTLEYDTENLFNIDMIDDELKGKPKDKAVIHIYIDKENNPDDAVQFVKYQFEKNGISCKINIESISQENWANNWKKYFKPTEIGDKLLILPEWEEAPETNRKILKIDPGAAFGTGTHSTTKLCLSAVEKYVKEGCTVLDIGTGSGILSVASLLMGADSAFGVDIDKLAVKTAIENGLKNGFSETKLKFVCGDLADKVSGKYDICIANIVADVIIRLCDSVGEYIENDGLFIASGIIDLRKEKVIEKIENSGFEIKEVYEDKNWYCIVSVYKGGKQC